MRLGLRAKTRVRLKKVARRLVGAESTPASQSEPDPYGLTLQPGDPHYRAYVGPPADYDLIAGIQFSLLFAVGMRETHRVLDVGCGSLRGGRLLIPYLRPGNYFGQDPNQWLIDSGIREEIGQDLVRLKRPRFSTRADFRFEDFGETFDFVMAQSILSHTYFDLAIQALRGMEAVLAPRGLILATFVTGPSIARKAAGWEYPGCVNFDAQDIAGAVEQSGLASCRLDWPHPRQEWHALAKPGMHAEIEELARRLRSPLSP